MLFRNALTMINEFGNCISALIVVKIHGNAMIARMNI